MSGPAHAGTAALIAAILAVAAFALGRDSAHNSVTAAGTPSAVDVGFSQDMTVHHNQAVLMANMAIVRGDPAVQGIADSILTAQSQELGQMRGWLQLWDKPLADPHPMQWMQPAMSGAMSGTMSGTMSDAMTMPGMATPSQLSTLYGLTGKPFDVLFLQLMIRHHQGGIEMAHYAETHARLPAVRTAATAMRVEQVQDLAEMIPLLEADGGKELPSP